MAKASVETIHALRKTAASLQQSTTYQWGHMGACNCGFLAQEVTHLQKSEIHTRAMQGHGDWTEQLNDYCPTSGLLFDDLVSELIAFGFDTTDLKNLERLSDGEVLRTLPAGKRNLKHNVKQDVVTYLLAWADLLENKVLASIQLPNLQATFSVAID
jgi:hypothetical protein